MKVIVKETFTSSDGTFKKGEEAEVKKEIADKYLKVDFFEKVETKKTKK